MQDLGQKEAQLSPLDQIRLAEAEVTRKIAVARRDCEQILADAKTEAQLQLVDARENGKRKGRARFRDIVTEAEEEARAIRAGAEHRARLLLRQGNRKMDIAIHQVVNIVTGTVEG